MNCLYRQRSLTTYVTWHFILLILLILTLNGNIKAAQPTYIVGVEDHDYYPHYSYKNNQFNGAGDKILAAFTATQGYQFIYHALPVARLFHTFTQDQLDFKYPAHPQWGKSLKKDKKIYYSTPVFRYIDGVMVHPSNKGRTIGKFKKLGTILGFTVNTPEWVKLLKNKDVTLYTARNFSNLTNMTRLHYIDGIYANIVVSRNRLHKMGQVNALIFDSSLPYTDDFYYLATTKHAEIITEFNAFLAANPQLVEQIVNELALNENMPPKPAP